ncbi:MAG: sugar kinase [Nitrososphaeria archaeon]|nr:sugar kinase [Nitrososphaeria archaeon]NIN52064.1 sugar kinase [Nitrososphaeria archaeon]NIQ32525.1 sugar kinase [Nitrososphaeria archaeon]
MEKWQQEGIDTSQVIVEKGGFTGVHFLMAERDGSWSAIYYRKDSCASHFSPTDVDSSYIRNAKVFHCSGISQAISSTCMEATFKAARIAKEAGVLFSYDPNIRLKLWPVDVARAIVNYTLEITDIALLSVDEAKLITGLESPEEAAKFLLWRGPSILAIKLGRRGCLIATEDDMFEVSGFEVNVVDTVASGDAFDGAFIVGLLEKMPLKKIGLFANAAGALKCMGRGAVPSIPHRSDVIHFLHEKGISL